MVGDQLDVLRPFLSSLHNIRDQELVEWLLRPVWCFGVWTQYVVFQWTGTLYRQGLKITGASQFTLNLVCCGVQLEQSCQDCRCQRQRCERVTAAVLWVRLAAY